MNEKAALGTEQNRQLQQLTDIVNGPLAAMKPLGSDVVVQSRGFVRRREAFVEDVEESDDGDLLYSMRIPALEAQKRELLQAIRDEKQNGETRIMELTLMLEGEENDRKAELEALQHKLEKQEETAKKAISRLYAELDAAQQKRKKLMQGQKAKIDDLEGRIRAADVEFGKKLSEATQVAEALKTRLVNSNLRKNQHLELERKRSSQQQKLLQETYDLHREVFDMQRRANVAREESGVLRRELSVCIGPRRTASLFM
jgi:hypothetical protein